ncbi:MAG: hypothetical protein QM730_14165 [Anaerolineales bacterium]
MQLNKRLVWILSLFGLILILICFALYSLVNPKFDQIATATVEQRTSVAATSTVSIIQTQTAAPTPTLTLTPSPIPTSTITITPLPLIKECTGQTTSAAFLYEYPSLGRIGTAVSVPAKETVTVVGKPENLDWYLVKYQNQKGWIIGNSLGLSSDCDKTPIDLAFLMDFGGASSSVLLSETFYGHYIWVDQSGNTIDTRRSSDGTQFIQVDGSKSFTEVKPESYPFTSMGIFRILTSYKWSGNGDYGGIRLFYDDGSYIDIRVKNSCYIDLYISQTDKTQTKQISAGKNQCYDQMPNFLDISAAPSDGNLQVRLNDSEEALLKIPQGTIVNFALIANRAKMDLDFLVAVQK